VREVCCVVVLSLRVGRFDHLCGLLPLRNDTVICFPPRRHRRSDRTPNRSSLGTMMTYPMLPKLVTR
jgi:hypothetical protein